jgi:glucose/arabinose dehydrogenase
MHALAAARVIPGLPAPAIAACFAALLATAPAHAQGQPGIDYQIPPDNPFVGHAGAAPEVYALGLRNPFRFSFDRLTGDLLIGDVGGGVREEINWIGAAAARGANFGWPCREGRAPGPRPDKCPIQGAVEPLFDYPTPSPGAVIGGYVARDPALAGVVGRYLFADHYSGDIHSLRLDMANPDDRTTGLIVDGIGGFGEDAAGRLYAADLGDGQVLRLTAGNTPGTLGAEPAGTYTMPVAIAPEPGNPDRVFVAELGGVVRLGAGSFVNVAQLPPGLAVGGERGLLSVAAAPDYPSSGRVYVYYTDSGGDVRVEEISRSTVDPNIADPATRRTLLVIEHSQAANHNGGSLQFGPDGCLWITTGDGGGQDDQFNNAQNLGTHSGKILRIDPDPPGRGGPVCQLVPTLPAPAPPIGGPTVTTAPLRDTTAPLRDTTGPLRDTTAPLRDTTGPRLWAQITRRQRVLRLRGAIAYARCDESCTVAARGTLRIGRRALRLRRARGAAALSQQVRLRVRLTRRSVRALRTASTQRRRAFVRVRLQASDRAGNRSQVVRARVRVQHPRRGSRRRAR